MADSMHDDPANWTRGPLKLYFARGDRRFWVPKYRPWMGWTINFAHPLGPVVLIGLMLLPALITVVAAVARGH